MNFESIIGKISGTIAAVVVFLLASGMYLSLKGFVIGEDGKPVLVREAHANEKPADPAEVIKDIKENHKNIIFPKNHVLGKKNAPVTIYEYSSFGCSHCSDFHLRTLPKIKEEYIDTGKVKLIFADFPLDQRSFGVSLVARCIPADKYYDFVALMFKNQREIGFSKNFEEVLTNYASLNGISKVKAQECLKNNDMATELAAIRQQGIDVLKIQGTPTFVIKTNDKIEIIPGAPGYKVFKNVIEDLLKEEPVNNK